LPATSGPCRFGLYNCLHKTVLADAGFGDVAIISPNQDNSFYREIGNIVGKNYFKFAVDIWSAVVGIDLLIKLHHRTRPFAKDRDCANAIYNKCLKQWLNAIENKFSLSKKRELMANFAREFSSLNFDWNISKPCIGVVGEIYVRNHPFASNDTIKKIEELGAVCSLASVAEWIYYTNFTRMARTNKRNIVAYSLNLVIDRLERSIEKSLAVPLEKKFGKLAEPEIKQILNYALPYLHPSFEGEAILTIGKTIEFYHTNHSGVVNVMPFSCMPSTIVSSLTPQLSKELNNFPILNLSFDGSEDASFQTRLEAFFEQCSADKELMVTAQKLFGSRR
jgi:predicted nucleotide-binding protein (sugar kinase/HSP70/actin superfamily)